MDACIAFSLSLSYNLILQDAPVGRDALFGRYIYLESLIKYSPQLTL